MKEIMIDVDDVLNDWHGHFLSYVGLVTGKNYAVKDMPRWSLPDMTDVEAKAIHQDYIKAGYYREVPIRIEARQALKDISNYRNILLCTARELTLHEDTKYWMRRNGLQKYHVTFEKDKVTLCKNRNITEIVDDHVDTVTKAADAGLTVYGVVRPYNIDVINSNKKIIPVTGLDGILAHINPIGMSQCE